MLPPLSEKQNAESRKERPYTECALPDVLGSSALPLKPHSLPRWTPMPAQLRQHPPPLLPSVLLFQTAAEAYSLMSLEAVFF